MAQVVKVNLDQNVNSPRQFSAEFKSQVVEFARNHSARETSSHFSLSINTLYKWLQKEWWSVHNNTPAESAARRRPRISHSRLAKLASKQSNNISKLVVSQTSEQANVDPPAVIQSQPQQYKYKDEFKSEVLQFAERSPADVKSGREFKIKRKTVATWRKKPNMKQNIPMQQYSAKFKDKVLTFSKINSTFVTGRYFHIPRSTVQMWRNKANMIRVISLQQYSEKIKSEVLLFSISNSIKVTGRKFNIHQSTIHKWRKKANMESKIPLQQYSDLFKSEVLEFSKSNSLKVTGRYFHIPRSTVQMWRNKTNIEPKLSLQQYSEKFKSKVLEFSISNSIKVTCRKFNIPQSTIHKWRKKANMESKIPLQQYSNLFKSEVLEFSISNSLKVTGRKFNIHQSTVQKWRKEAKMEPNIPTRQYSEKFKSTVLEFSKSNSYGVIRRHFNVPKSTVEKWRKKALMEPKIYLPQYSKNFKSEVLEFAKNASHAGTGRHFNIPEDTVGRWIRKAKQKPSGHLPQCSVKIRTQVINTFSALLNPPKRTYQEGVHMLVDISSILGEVLHSENGEELVKIQEEELNANTEDEEHSTQSRSFRYSNHFRKKVVTFAEEEGWKAASEKFGVAPGSIGFWARRMDKRLPKIIRNDETCLKEKTIGFEVTVPLRVNILNVETSKPLADKTWIKKKRNQPVVQKLALDFSQTQSWSESCNKFNVPIGSRSYLHKKLFGGTVNDLKKRLNAGVSIPQNIVIVTKTTEEIESTKRKRKGREREVSGMSEQNTETAGKCDACGYTLATGETLDEHLVSLHLTREGTCDICGEDSVDFMDHFKKHLGLQAVILLNVKEEIIEERDCETAADHYIPL